MVKPVFRSLGHYARWDLVNLTTPPQPYEPETNVPAALPTDVRDWVIETVAKEFKLEPEKVAEVIRNAA